MKRATVVMAAQALLLFLAGGGLAADCTKGKALYEEAVRQDSLSRRIALLKRSLEACPDFNAHYELGKAYEADGRLEEAAAALRNADYNAGTDKAKAKALSRLGVVHEKMGDMGAAHEYYRQSVKHHDYPKVRARLKRMDLARKERGMTSKDIKSALLTARSLVRVEPSLDLYINFPYDSAALDGEARQRADNLGRALTDSAFDGDRFVIIGHTDRVGSQSYNLPLSRRRADAVKAYLVDRFHIPPDRLRSEGRGKAELLYRGATQEDDALNRRVEVRVR